MSHAINEPYLWKYSNRYFYFNAFLVERLTKFIILKSNITENNTMNLTFNTNHTTDKAMGYLMLSLACAWCVPMFKKVRVSIKHVRRVVF